MNKHAAAMVPAAVTLIAGVPTKRYLQNQWRSLQRYLEDGRIPIDNNQSEQILRPLTTGRKNWLFLGHPRAAAGRLRLMSIVSR